MWKRFGKISHFMLNNNNDKSNFISDIRISISQLIQKNKSGNDKHNQYTWIHPDLAIQLAQWISLQFAIQVSKWIRTLFTNGKVEINVKLLKKKEKVIKNNEKNKNKDIYIIGKAINLTERLSTYNKSVEHEVIYYRACKNKKHMDLVEKMVLNVLDQFRERAN